MKKDIHITSHHLKSIIQPAQKVQKGLCFLASSSVATVRNLESDTRVPAKGTTKHSTPATRPESTSDQRKSTEASIANISRIVKQESSSTQHSQRLPAIPAVRSPSSSQQTGFQSKTRHPWQHNLRKLCRCSGVRWCIKMMPNHAKSSKIRPW